MDRILIRGGTVLTMTAPTEVFPDGLVAIEDGEIRFAGDGIDAPAGLDEHWATRVIDARDRLVLPGLVNPHTHAAMTLLRGYADDMVLMEWLEQKIFPIEAQLQGEDVYWGTALAALESLAAGVTTFNDMYFFMDDAARAVRDSGIRAVLGRGIVGSGQDARVRMDDARELHRRWQGGAGGRITVMLAPHAPYTVPPETLEAVAALAGELDAGIHIHLSETRGEVDAVWAQYGMSPIQLMARTGIADHHMVAAHCVHVSDEDIEILAANPGGVAHCPVSNLKLACGVAPVAAMREAGVRVGVGTDGAASSNQLQTWGELRLMALLQKNFLEDPKAFTAWDALHVATAGGAQVLGLGDTVGTLEPGKRADIILVRTDRPGMTPQHDPVSLLAYSANSGDVDTVLVDGRVVVDGGRLTTMDPQEIMARAGERAAALLRRA